MKKTDAILQYLDGCTQPQSTSEIAAGIDQADDSKNVSSLLAYLKTHGRVQTVDKGAGGAESTWQITATGRTWFTELTEEATQTAKPAKAIHEATRAKVAKKAREKAADPEKLAPLPRKKLQRTAAVLQTLDTVELTPPAPIRGRAIAVREDGAVLVIEDDVVITTLIPEDALRIASVVQRLQSGRPV
jgi:hypothetical protein